MHNEYAISRDETQRDTPLCAEVAEYRLIGAIAIAGGDALAAVAEILPSGDRFFIEQHGAWYQAALDLHRAGQDVTDDTVRDELRRRRAAGVPFAAGAFELHILADYIGECPNAGDAADYARSVREAWLKRQGSPHIEQAYARLHTDPSATLCAIWDELKERMEPLCVGSVPEERIASTDPLFWQRNAELSDERQRRSWTAGVVTLPTDGTDKAIIQAVRTLFEYRNCLTPGSRTGVHLESFGRHLHIGDATLGRRLRDLGKLGLWGYESKYGKDGHKHSELTYKSQLMTPWLAKWPERTRGGARPGAGRPTCPGCGSEDVVDSRLCRNCGQRHTLYDAQTAQASPDVRIVEADPPTPYSPSLNLYGEAPSDPIWDKFESRHPSQLPTIAAPTHCTHHTAPAYWDGDHALRCGTCHELLGSRAHRYARLQVVPAAG